MCVQTTVVQFFFLSHAKLLCSLMRKRHWRAILADPDTPRWPMPQAGHLHQLRIWTWAGGMQWEGTGKPVLLAAAAQCCHSCSEEFQLCNLQWSEVNLCRFSNCQDTVSLSPFPMSQQWGEAQLLKQTPPGYKQTIWRVGWGWSKGCLFHMWMMLKVAGSCSILWMTSCWSRLGAATPAWAQPALQLRPSRCQGKWEPAPC